MNDEFDRDLLCPYCAAQTTPAEVSCSTCKKKLVFTKPVQAERSSWLWRGFYLQIFMPVYLLAFGSAYYAFGARFLAKVPDNLSILPVYFGIAVEGHSTTEIEAVLTIFPRWLFWSLLLISLYSMCVAVIVIFRVRYGHLLYVFNAGLTTLFGLLVIASAPILLESYPLALRCVGMIFVAISIIQFYIAANLPADFQTETTRLILKIDYDVKDAGGFYLRARKYAEHEMWGNAVIHLRRAVLKKPGDLSFRLALIVGYINLKRYDLAQTALNDASQLEPNAPELQHLHQKLQDLQA